MDDGRWEGLKSGHEREILDLKRLIESTGLPIRRTNRTAMPVAGRRSGGARVGVSLLMQESRSTSRLAS